MAGLRVPLPTLRPEPYDPRRMTEGPGGLLDLSGTALASATPCRFYPGAFPGPFIGHGRPRIVQAAHARIAADGQPLLADQGHEISQPLTASVLAKIDADGQVNHGPPR